MTASSASAHKEAGFSLTELAIVFTIVALLLASAMYTLSAQTEGRNIADSQRRLEEARDLLVGFAMVNGRLPCPARYTSSASNSGGMESFCVAGAGTCAGTETTTVQSHGNCSNFGDGFLPAVAIGFTPTDASGFALDPWGNRIRYAVASKTANPAGATSCQTTAGVTLVGQKYLYTKTRATGESLIGCVPDEVVVCASGTGVTGTTCGTATSVTNANVVAAVVFSTGKNYITAATAAAAAAAGRTDEAANLNGDGVFVWHTPVGSGEANAFDDQILWLPAPLLYSKLIAAGVLP
jgi:type II secretory pathway pseudopilin PulG